METFIPIDVVTGGPGSGKSDLLAEADRQFGPEAVRLGRIERPKLMIIPEGATILINGGYPMPCRRFPWSQRWQDRFEQVNYFIHLNMEREIVRRARRAGCLFALADRSRRDILAYFRGDKKRYQKACGIDPDDVLGDYAEVILMETLATVDPEEYERIRRTRDTHRMERASRAVELDGFMREAWAGFRPLHSIPCMSSADEKIQYGIRLIAERIRKLEEAARSL